VHFPTKASDDIKPSLTGQSSDGKHADCVTRRDVISWGYLEDLSAVYDRPELLRYCEIRLNRTYMIQLIVTWSPGGQSTQYPAGNVG
jgi:hypothetical protein